MEPITFKECNQLLGAGNNPNTEDMPVCRAVHPEIDPENGGCPFIVSKWKLTPQELAEVNKTGAVWLCVMGLNTPPVLIVGHNPFEAHGYKALEAQV